MVVWWRILISGKSFILSGFKFPLQTTDLTILCFKPRVKIRSLSSPSVWERLPRFSLSDSVSHFGVSSKSWKALHAHPRYHRKPKPNSLLKNKWIDTQMFIQCIYLGEKHWYNWVGVASAEIMWCLNWLCRFTITVCKQNCIVLI